MSAPSFIKQLLGVATLALAHSAYAVVETGHWQSTNGPGAFGDGTRVNFVSAVDQTPAGDFTYVFMKYDHGVLSSEGFSADEGADVFVVKAGDTLSNAAIASQPPPFVTGPSITTWPALPINVGQDFYLGARTRSFADPDFDFATTFTTFGWAHFQVDATGLPQLVASAMAFKEGGIIVGTVQAVPEPSSLALMGLGLTGLLALRRRARPVGYPAPR